MHKMNDIPSFHFHPRCKKVDITHLLFADDLLMFYRANTSSVSNMMSTFDRFLKASRLEANTSKSNVYMSGVDRHNKKRLVHLLQMEEGVFPFRCLGVPLQSKKLNTRDCRPLVDKIIGRVKFWSSRLLSYAGRIQLVRSVIGGMKKFWDQIFCLPKKLIKMVEDVCQSFIWTSKEGLSRKAAVTWSQMVLPYTKQLCSSTCGI